MHSRWIFVVLMLAGMVVHGPLARAADANPADLAAEDVSIVDEADAEPVPAFLCTQGYGAFRVSASVRGTGELAATGSASHSAAAAERTYRFYQFQCAAQGTFAVEDTLERRRVCAGGA